MSDLANFKNADLSLVGEKGLTLSGGQRARINLARALYTDAEIYLLDDPLAAVDTKVVNFLYENAISTFLKNKAWNQRPGLIISVMRTSPLIPESDSHSSDPPYKPTYKCG